MPLNLDSLAPPISLRPSVTLSDEELMRFSEDNKPYKIERNNRGEITIMTPVGGIGSAHEEYVSGEFYIWTKRDGTGKGFSPSAGFNLPDGSCLSPDVAWMTLDRWTSLTVKQQTGFPPLCPDFVIEVRSATDPRQMVEAKMQLWMNNGARLAWLVDPIDENVTVYRPGYAPETLDHPRLIAATAPVEGFVLDCSLLWPESNPVS
jgi:Uma2 family endonuclease